MGLIQQLTFYLTWLCIWSFEVCMAKITLQKREVNFAHCVLEEELVPNPSGSVCGVCECSSSGQALHSPALGKLGKSCTMWRGAAHTLCDHGQGSYCQSWNPWYCFSWKFSLLNDISSLSSFRETFGREKHVPVNLRITGADLQSSLLSFF